MGNKRAVVILAAGQGKRMRSDLPKVLHPCAGLPLIGHMVEKSLKLKASSIVVVVSPKDKRVETWLRTTYAQANLVFAPQPKPLGTGDALKCALKAITKFSGEVLIMCGDTPLLGQTTLNALIRRAKGKNLALLSTELENPHGYGRILRDGMSAQEIIEEKDATKSQKTIREINAGVYVAQSAWLRLALQKLRRSNAQGEYYLTDIVALAAKAGPVGILKAKDSQQMLGINTSAHLQEVEAIFRKKLIAAHQAKGVVFRDPNNTFIAAQVQLAKGAVIGVGVQIYGASSIGVGAQIDGPTFIKDSTIATGATIHSFSHLEGAKVGKGASVGPYGRLRTGADLQEGSKVGNFVEIKRTRLGKGAKANHLAYLGDSVIGEKSNVGAGTITCNYDGGPVKHKTRLGENVFIGSNSTLVAPVDLEDGVFVAAGSTITQNVQKDSLAFGRARQSNRKGYAKSLRKKIKEGR